MPSYNFATLTGFSHEQMLLFRVFRLLFGPVVKLDLMRHLSPPNNNSISECLLNEFSHFNFENQQISQLISVIVGLVLAGRIQSAEELPSSNSELLQYLGTLQFSLVSHLVLVDVCWEHVFSDKTVDVPFYDFTKSSHMCQWLPQDLRIIAWVRTFMPYKVHATSISNTSSTHSNVHTLHLVAFFIDQTEKKLAKDVPAYTFVEADYSINEQELLLQQCIQGNDLNWGDLHYKWSIFPYSLDYLMKLILIYPQPLKLLACMSTASLFRILENLKRERFSAQVARLRVSLQHAHLVIL